MQWQQNETVTNSMCYNMAESLMLPERGLAPRVPVLYDSVDMDVRGREMTLLDRLVFGGGGEKHRLENALEFLFAMMEIFNILVMLVIIQLYIFAQTP